MAPLALAQPTGFDKDKGGENIDTAPIATPTVKSIFTTPTILPLANFSTTPETSLPPAAQTNGDIAAPTKDSKNDPKKNNQSIQSGEALNNLFEDSAEAAIPDPNEANNRQILDFNIFLDRAFLKPLSTVVTVVLPKPVAQILRNILSNMQEPSKFVFLTFSGHFTDGLLTLSRFTINSTLGIAGAFDPASSFTPALRTKDATADLMLASWGVPIGNYTVAFFGGPNNTRAGLAGGIELINPSSLALSLLFPNQETIVRGSMLGASATLNRPAALDSLADFADPYAVARSVYWQNSQQREKDYVNKK